MATFIDIGSMKGEEIKWGIEHGYEVIAFEPNTHLKEDLKPYEDKATIIWAAAWDREGTERLYGMMNPEPGEDGISLIKEKVNVSKQNFTRVPIINIGAYLRKLDKDIDILKINAEGAEYVILESILNHFDPKRIKRWFVEDHANYITSPKWRAHKEKVLRLVGKRGVVIEDWNKDILLNL